MEKPVKDTYLKKGEKVADLVKKFSEAGGFTAAKLGRGKVIWDAMQADKDCTVFLSHPACIIATGTRGIIRDIIKDKKAGVLMTTCGTLDHDIARSLGKYWQGKFNLNDVELRQQNKARLGNVVVTEKEYGHNVEDFVQSMLSDLYKERKEWNTRDLCWEVGKRLKEDSILYWAWKNKVPVFLPGPLDGTFGCQLWMFYESHKDFKLNLFEDEHALSDIAFTAKKTGALILGGGISKHHAQWWNQFRGGLDYAVQITSAPEWDGSLSGAKLKEAVSWNKIQVEGQYESIEGDITVLLPLLVSE